VRAGGLATPPDLVPPGLTMATAALVHSVAKPATEWAERRPSRGFEASGLGQELRQGLWLARTDLVTGRAVPGGHPFRALLDLELPFDLRCQLEESPCRLLVYELLRGQQVDLGSEGGQVLRSASFYLGKSIVDGELELVDVVKELIADHRVDIELPDEPELAEPVSAAPLALAASLQAVRRGAARHGPATDAAVGTTSTGTAHRAVRAVDVPTSLVPDTLLHLPYAGRTKPLVGPLVSISVFSLQA
jgi:uncharacterized protein YceK